MKDKQFELLDKIRSASKEVMLLEEKYWQIFSNFETWQFWVLFLMLILPLIILFIFIDKQNMLLLGFFGLNYHVWFSYTNIVGIRLGLWEYPYNLIPYLPSFSLDASFIPVCFMFLYQWTLNHNKNIYLYAIPLSAAFAFILKPIMVKYHFIHMYHGINYFHLFLFYMAYFIISILITNFFLWNIRKNKKA